MRAASCNTNIWQLHTRQYARNIIMKIALPLSIVECNCIRIWLARSRLQKSFYFFVECYVQRGRQRYHRATLSNTLKQGRWVNYTVIISLFPTFLKMLNEIQTNHLLGLLWQPTNSTSLCGTINWRSEHKLDTICKSTALRHSTTHMVVVLLGFCFASDQNDIGIG